MNWNLGYHYMFLLHKGYKPQSWLVRMSLRYTAGVLWWGRSIRVRLYMLYRTSDLLAPDILLRGTQCELS